MQSKTQKWGPIGLCPKLFIVIVFCCVFHIFVGCWCCCCCCCCCCCWWLTNISNRTCVPSPNPHHFSMKNPNLRLVSKLWRFHFMWKQLLLYIQHKWFIKTPKFTGLKSRSCVTDLKANLIECETWRGLINTMSIKSRDVQTLSCCHSDNTTHGSIHRRKKKKK